MFGTSMFGVLSHVPMTRPYRRYAATVAYVENIEALTEELCGSPPPKFPRPIPRSPAACEIAVEAMLAVVRALQASAAGASTDEVVAVLQEHMPVAS